MRWRGLCGVHHPTAASVDDASGRAALIERWRQVLTAGADLDPSEAVVVELAEYFGIDQDEARRRCDNYMQHSVDDWHESARATPEELVDYWNRWGPMFGVLMSHARQYTQEHPASSVDIAQAIAVRPVGDLLDFGMGPGTSSLFFDKLGWRVVGADVAESMLDFARWRMTRRGVDFPLVDLRSESLPNQAFDVVVALEVMAHVPDINATLGVVRSSLRPGGLFIFNVYAPPSGPNTYGHLFVGNWHVIRHVRAVGFAKKSRIGKYYMYERVERSPLRAAVVRVYDHLRQSQPVSDTAQWTRGLLTRVRR